MAEYKNINLHDLKLDLYNPRLPKSKQGKSENTVIEFMLLESATLELMMAIGENDFFAGEQLLVIPDDSGKFIVVEGNRRLTAVKLLSQPELASVKKESIRKICKEAAYKPTSIPCLEFSERQEILKYLGFRHITGIKSWRLLEKGRYLSELRETEFKEIPFLQACRDIAKSIGSSSSYIRRLLTSVKLYNIVEDEGFYSIENLSDTRFHLNYFTDALNKENLREFIGVNYNSENPLADLNENNLKRITHWWFEKSEGKSRVLGDSSSLKMFNEIVGNSNALKAFENGTTIELSYELTNDIDNIFKNEIEKSLRAIEIADSYCHKVKEFYPSFNEDLKGINSLTKKIRSFKLQKENEDDDF